MCDMHVAATKNNGSVHTRDRSMDIVVSDNSDGGGAGTQNNSLDELIFNSVCRHLAVYRRAVCRRLVRACRLVARPRAGCRRAGRLQPGCHRLVQ